MSLAEAVTDLEEGLTEIGMEIVYSINFWIFSKCFIFFLSRNDVNNTTDHHFCDLHQVVCNRMVKVFCGCSQSNFRWKLMFNHVHKQYYYKV